MAQEATIWFEDMPLHGVRDLGQHLFTEEEIIAFAKAYDPAPLHTDPVAAAAGPYGGLTASPNHLAAIWMQLMLTYRNPGENKAGGPSPGFIHLKTPIPVRPGDTITFRNTLVEKIDLNSRPEWGLARNLNEGFNQAGELVFDFLGQAFMRRRPLED